jgi:hypothetical protein
MAYNYLNQNFTINGKMWTVRYDTHKGGIFRVFCEGVPAPEFNRRTWYESKREIELSYKNP